MFDVKQAYAPTAPTAAQMRQQNWLTQDCSDPAPQPQPDAHAWMASGLVDPEPSPEPEQQPAAATALQEMTAAKSPQPAQPAPQPAAPQQTRQQLPDRIGAFIGPAGSPAVRAYMRSGRPARVTPDGYFELI